MSDMDQDWEEAKAEIDVPFSDFMPGTYGCHEAMHMASVLHDAVSEHLMSHAAVVQNREWYGLALEASDALWRLYQAIGAVHLPALPEQEARSPSLAGG